MKKFILIAVLIPISVGTFAQDVKAIYNKYSNAKGAETIYISEAMFQLMQGLPEGVMDIDIDVMPYVKSLKALYIINCEGMMAESLSNDVQRLVSAGKFQLLMEVNSDMDKLKIYIVDDGKDIVTNFVLLAADEADTALIALDGVISKKDLRNLVSKD